MRTVAVIVNSNRVLTHHNTPESVHASWDLASKTVNSKDAHLRSDILGVVRHGGAEQSFSLERVGFMGRKASCLMETSTDKHSSCSQGGSEVREDAHELTALCAMFGSI